jgi:hypothetical protein
LPPSLLPLLSLQAIDGLVSAFETNIKSRRRRQWPECPVPSAFNSRPNLTSGCPSQRNQSPSMGGQFVVHFLSLWCCGGAPWFYLLTSIIIIEQNKRNFAMWF